MCSKEDFETFCLNKKLTPTTLSIFSKGSKYEATVKVTGDQCNVTKEALADTAEGALSKARLFVCMEIEQLSATTVADQLNDLEKYCRTHGYTYKITYTSTETEKVGVEGEIQIFKKGEDTSKVTLPFVTINYINVHTTATEKALLYFQSL